MVLAQVFGAFRLYSVEVIRTIVLRWFKRKSK